MNLKKPKRYSLKKKNNWTKKNEPNSPKLEQNEKKCVPISDVVWNPELFGNQTIMKSAEIWTFGFQTFTVL